MAVFLNMEKNGPCKIMKQIHTWGVSESLQSQWLICIQY